MEAEDIRRQDTEVMINDLCRRVVLALQGVDPLRLNAGNDNFAEGIASFVVFPGTCRG